MMIRAWRTKPKQRLQKPWRVVLLTLTTLVVQWHACFLSCQGRTTTRRVSALVLPVLSALPAATASAADDCEGSIFEGTYKVPQSLGGTAEIRVRASQATLRGTTGWECKSTKVQGAPLFMRVAGAQRQMIVDFSPIGGPKSLRGRWAGGVLDLDSPGAKEQAIVWDDGTRWQKISCAVKG
mmetsp:Transcript_21700/g.49392  ORF Transcript_21700/g.49392 Transcript_21700/m.49392 type:complete len:181 (+) Transcript_21700:51-593(+)